MHFYTIYSSTSHSFSIFPVRVLFQSSLTPIFFSNMKINPCFFSRPVRFLVTALWCECECAEWCIRPCLSVKQVDDPTDHPRRSRCYEWTVESNVLSVLIQRLYLVHLLSYTPMMVDVDGTYQRRREETWYYSTCISVISRRRGVCEFPFFCSTCVISVLNITLGIRYGLLREIFTMWCIFVGKNCASCAFNHRKVVKGQNFWGKCDYI